MSTPLALATVRNLHRDAEGTWRAEVILEGATLRVMRDPSWHTEHKKGEPFQEILPEVAALLQDAVHAAEGDTRTWRRR